MESETVQKRQASEGTTPSRASMEKINEAMITRAREIARDIRARHRSAAGITALTQSLAVVISESTGDVRIFNRG